MNKRHLLIALAAAFTVVTGCSTTSPKAEDPASERRKIDSEVDAALATLFAQQPGSRELVSRARGVLVFPSVISAGFMVGGSYGQGALRVGGQTAGYYSTAAGSVGLLAGAQSKAIYLLFMTEESLAKFQNSSKGWTAGADASVAMINLGADASATTATLQQPVIGYALTNGGLMANLSIDGTKFTRLSL